MMKSALVLLIFARSADGLSIPRRQLLADSFATLASSSVFLPTAMANAADDDEYNNPNIPAAPEERCKTSATVCLVFHLCHGSEHSELKLAGLVVLRVAEVAQFQEKILRAILNGDIKDVVVTPQQM